MESNQTLGARLVANMAYAALHPVEEARKKAVTAGTEQQFATVEALFARFKVHISDAVEAGNFPKPLQLNDQELSALNTYSWNSSAKAPCSTHFAYPLWQEVVSWGDSEGLKLEWKYAHDGVGIKSWWNLLVISPQAPRINAKH